MILQHLSPQESLKSDNKEVPTWSGVWILSGEHDTVLLSLGTRCRWYICKCVSDL